MRCGVAARAAARRRHRLGSFGASPRARPGRAQAPCTGARRAARTPSVGARLGWRRRSQHGAQPHAHPGTHVGIEAVSDHEHGAGVAPVTLLAEHPQRVADHVLVALRAALAAVAQPALAARVHELAEHAGEHTRAWQREDRLRVVGVDRRVEGVLRRDHELRAVRQHVARLNTRRGVQAGRVGLQTGRRAR
eukprot:scaffold138317_cov127-Phaeocystis_antarctica.AAC.1